MKNRLRLKNRKKKKKKEKRKKKKKKKKKKEKRKKKKEKRKKKKEKEKGSSPNELWSECAAAALAMMKIIRFKREECGMERRAWSLPAWSAHK